MEDSWGDVWRIFGDVLDCFSYSFGVFWQGFLEGFYGIFLDSIFSIQNCKVFIRNPEVDLETFVVGCMKIRGPAQLQRL